MHELTVSKNMIFLNGINDNLVSSVLHSIEWKLSYNIMKGVCEDSPAFQAVVPDARNADSGEFIIEAPPMAGSQQTAIAWYRNEGKINLRIIEISRAK